jgi:hypothetical protein
VDESADQLASVASPSLARTWTRHFNKMMAEKTELAAQASLPNTGPADWRQCEWVTAQKNTAPLAITTRTTTA